MKDWKNWFNIRARPAVPVRAPARLVDPPPPPPRVVTPVARPVIRPVVRPPVGGHVRPPTVGGHDPLHAAPPQPVRRSRAWHGPGSKVHVNGYMLHGMVYVGVTDGLACVVDPALEVDALRPVPADPGRLPPYHRMSPSHRGAFLRWCATGRTNANAPVGYAMLHLVGLERRLLTGNPSPPEQALIVTEIHRLTDMFPDAAPFQSSAFSLLDEAQCRHVLAGGRPTFTAQCRGAPLPSLRTWLSLCTARGEPAGTDALLTFALSSVRQDVRLPPIPEADLPLLAFMAREDGALETLVLRGGTGVFEPNAYRQLVPGMVVQRPAVPNGLREPESFDWHPVREVLDRLIASMREERRKTTRAARLAAPPKVPSAAAGLGVWLAAREDSPHPVRVLVPELLARTLGKGNAKPTLSVMGEAALVLHSMGWGLEPDPADGPSVSRSEERVLFPLDIDATAGARSLRPCAGHSVRACLLWLMGGNLVRLNRYMPAAVTCPPGGAVRLEALAALGMDGDIKALRMVVRAMTPDDKSYLLRLAPSVAAASGADPETILRLEEVHRACGGDARSVHAALHVAMTHVVPRRVAGDPVVLLHADAEILHAIPRQPAAASSPSTAPHKENPPVAAVVVPPPPPLLDREALRRVARETHQVQAALEDVWREDVTPSSSEDDAAPTDFGESALSPDGEIPLSKSTTLRFPGLETRLATLLDVLAARAEWSRVDLAEAVAAAGLPSVDAALEGLNEWSWERLDAAVVEEDGDVVTVFSEVLSGV